MKKIGCLVLGILFCASAVFGAEIANKSIGGILDVLGGGDPVSLTAPIIGEATGTSLDLGGTTLFASRAITVDTGGVLNIATGSAAGDDFTVNTSQFVVEGDTGNVGIGTASPEQLLSLQKDQNAARPVQDQE